MLKRVLNSKSLNNISKDPEFTKFCKEIIVIIEHKPFGKKVVFEDFIKRLKGLLGPQSMSIHDTIIHCFGDWPGDFVQKKGLEYGEAKSFNVPLRLLISENFEKLLSYMGNVAFQCLLADAVLLKQEKETFWQINGRSLEHHFEEMKKRKKERKASPNREKNRKKNIKVKTNKRAYFKDFVNRNHMLYCLHSNKKPGMFKKSIIESLATELRTIEKKSNILTPDDRKDCLLDLGNQFINHIFEEMSIPTNVGKYQLKGIMSNMIQKYSKINIEKVYKKHIKKPECYGDIKTSIDEFLKGKSNVTDTQIAEFLSILVKLDNPVKNVTNFIKEIIGKTVPKELFGVQNYQVVLDHCLKLITMKKFEVMAYEDVMKLMKFDQIPWLDVRKRTKQHMGSWIADANLIVREMLTWMFNKFVIEFIRMNFYVTEKHNEHNRLFFYSKPVWYLITRCSMAN